MSEPNSTHLTNPMLTTTYSTDTASGTGKDDFWEPSITTALYASVALILGIIVTVVLFKCYYRKRRSLHYRKPREREESFHHDNAVYWDHDAAFQLDGMVELREQRRTEAVFITDSRHRGIQTDIGGDCIHNFERNYQQDELDNMSLPPLPPPPPPPIEDPLPHAMAPNPPSRRSKDDCIRTVPSYRKSNIPSTLQKTWIFNSEDKLATSDHFKELLDEAFKDQNSPLHQRESHYMSVPSVVLIPNPEEGPPCCHDIRHSYINIKKLDGNTMSENSLNNSQQILVDYENTRVWVKSKESDLSDDESHVDFRDANFQDCVRNTLHRKEIKSRNIPEVDDQYSSFATLSAPKKPERPRTGYVVMELTEEVMSFLKVKENKLGKHLTLSHENLPSEIYYDDRLKNGYISMTEN
ncbi:uncharacterized protein LOC127724548 isoform X1 [Mytilus californianus]|uniref:uncharacterized protein LOC127724548 isoform X1 n=1 Tax=Mytilus californianus TaxID=6549 RepID=UPI002246796C|nr:uncharacterized protein LOC127724548 isoform X1 [Mytilus californianus]